MTDPPTDPAHIEERAHTMTDLHTLAARRDQLVTDLCQLHLDALGASQVGDFAGEAEASALMATIQNEIAEIDAALAQQQEERARVEDERTPTRAERAVDAAWIDHCTARNDYHSLPHNAPAWERNALRARMERTLDAVRRAEDAVRRAEERHS